VKALPQSLPDNTLSWENVPAQFELIPISHAQSGVELEDRVLHSHCDVKRMRTGLRVKVEGLIRPADRIDIILYFM
jgi:hypothetical protein